MLKLAHRGVLKSPVLQQFQSTKYLLKFIKEEKSAGFCKNGQRFPLNTIVERGFLFLNMKDENSIFHLFPSLDHHLSKSHDKSLRWDIIILFSPVNGHWSPWGQYSQCTKTCGGGSRYRTRACDNPAPSSGGKHCTGPSQQTNTCNTQGCPGKYIGFLSILQVKFVLDWLIRKGLKIT